MGIKAKIAGVAVIAAASSFGLSPWGQGFIAKWEGLGPVVDAPIEGRVDDPSKPVVTLAYQDIGGVWTICHGRTKGVRPGDSASLDQCADWLLEDAEWAADLVRKWVDVPITQAQFIALVSIIYNVGPGRRWERSGIVWLKNGRHSTLLTKLNAGDCWGAAAEFRKWNKVGTTPVRGLTNRRMEERRLFESGCTTEMG